MLNRLFGWGAEKPAPEPVPEVEKTPEINRSELVQFNELPTEKELRDGILKLLQKLDKLAPPEETSNEKMIGRLISDDFNQGKNLGEANVVRQEIEQAIKQMNPEENDPNNLALYEQLQRIAYTLWKFHISENTKLLKPLEQKESSGAYLSGIMDLGVDPKKAIHEAVMQAKKDEKSRMAHIKKYSVDDPEARMREAISRLDPDLDFEKPEEPAKKIRKAA
jgi:hypothetical protein